MNKITAITILLIAITIAATAYTGLNGYNPFKPPYYTMPEGAPNGVYTQKDWGSYDNQTNTWYFAICDHDYLGPLHGAWQVANNTWVPIWKTGVYPIDARLILTLENNTIVKAEVHSWNEYGD
jgi:hypothetical protein